MNGRIRMTGLAAVRTELRTMATRVPEGARKTMHRSAQIIVEQARKYAPEDTGNLVRGIQIIKDYAGANGRLQIDVGIMMPPDAFSASGTPLTEAQFDRYVTLVHENYESIIQNPGKRTQQKMGENPGKVGSGFLTRAAAEEGQKLEAKTIAAITQIIREVQKD
ncbi:putative tail component protein [Rhizobium phage RHph_X66]|nr:putative tail component protein [Rhizobium phage RHph_X66]